MQEASADTASDWNPVASDVENTDYTVNEISPKKDYNFRIRAEMENGDVSEPTPDIQYFRSKVPMSKEPFELTEHKPVEYDPSFASRSYVEHLTRFVPPRMPIEKPDMISLSSETVELSWKPAREPDSIRNISNLTYTIEVKSPPSFEWSEQASGLKTLTYKAEELHPKIDYSFRVRAVNDYGSSEAGLPVHLYRPIDPDDIVFYDDEEEDFQREYDEEFGGEEEEYYEEEIDIEKVPPKLPMDTPRILSQTPDSIWFSWLPARIPAYATQTKITYVIEIKEPPNPQWRRDVTGLVDCQYCREGLDPNKDYSIQVVAESEFGESDPTLPLIIKGKETRISFTVRKTSSSEPELDQTPGMGTARLEAITGGVPPRMSSSRPLCINAQPDRLTMSWSACRVPSYVKSSGVTYIIERREPPGHIWVVQARDVKETRYDVTELNPELDYMFRVRAKNEYGVSEPSLPMCIYRDRDDYVPQKVRSRSGSRESLSMLTSWKRRSSSIDYEGMKSVEADPLMEAVQRDRLPLQPEYITTTYDTQYGVLGKKGKVTLQVRGYPLPTVHWYQGEEKLQYGDDYNAFITPKGEINLEIKNVTADSVGEYKCFAENESGAAAKVVSFRLGDPPTVLRPLVDITQSSNAPCTLTCTVDGIPTPSSAKWTKDWLPLADSTRIKAVTSSPGTFSLEIDKALVTDSGIYACTVENVAGSVTLTSRVVIDETEPYELKLNSAPIEDQYVILEELGRGRNGVVRKVIELSSGRPFAANFMFLRNKAQKNYFLSEFAALRSVRQMDSVLKLHDAFESDRALIFVTEILSGPELMEKMVADGDWTEARVAGVVKQLLTTLLEFESLGLVHLDIKPTNIRLQTEVSDKIKLINFGTSRFLYGEEEEVFHNYGSVGYASPEQVGNDIITATTDLWAVGILTYILLSGTAPFSGNTDAEILRKSLDAEWKFDDKAFGKITKDARKFIKKLLQRDPRARPSVSDMLKHPWLATTSEVKVNQESLKNFYQTEKLKNTNQTVYTSARLQSLTKLYHGAAALYQPAVDMDTGEIIFPDTDKYGDFLEEEDWYDWQIQYVDDPDSQLFPLHNKDFNIRQASHVADSPSPKPKEREDKIEPDIGDSVMFRNKIQPVTFTVGDDVEFMCTVISLNETPVITWYRDETLLSDAYRVEATFKEETGVAKLKVFNTKDYDAAIYKCVARNKDGRVSCQAPLLVGDKPGRPGRPVVTQTSGREAFVTWTGPASDGNSYILGYRVDYKTAEGDWTRGPYVTEEYALVSGLVPNTKYMFRVSCHNNYGASSYSWASLETCTGKSDSDPVTIATYLQPLVQFSSFSKQQLILQAESRRPSLSAPEEALLQEADPAETYDIEETISKGSYGEYKNVTHKETKVPGVAKVVPYSRDRHYDVTKEFKLLRNLRQFHVITVMEGFVYDNSFYTIYERLSGINIVQYLCLCRSYKEELVSLIVRQILDALQYIQRFGIAHLNLQPSSVIMATRRRPHVKLRDFTHARVIQDGKGEKMAPVGYADFVAPEMIRGEPVDQSADIWAVGAIAFTLLSGASPFAGNDLQETCTNILFDRYNASDMFDNATKDSVKFISRLLMRLPKNRPTVNKCLSYRWVQYTDNMIKTRSTRSFQSERLRDFCTLYQKRRADQDYMSIDKVDLEALPKPTIGLATRPILPERSPNSLASDIIMSEDEFEEPIIADVGPAKEVAMEPVVEDAVVADKSKSVEAEVPKAQLKEEKSTTVGTDVKCEENKTPIEQMKIEKEAAEKKVESPIKPDTKRDETEKKAKKDASATHETEPKKDEEKKKKESTPKTIEKVNDEIEKKKKDEVPPKEEAKKEDANKKQETLPKKLESKPEEAKMKDEPHKLAKSKLDKPEKMEPLPKTDESKTDKSKKKDDLPKKVEPKKEEHKLEKSPSQKNGDMNTKDDSTKNATKQKDLEEESKPEKPQKKDEMVKKNEAKKKETKQKNKVESKLDKSQKKEDSTKQSDLSKKEEKSDKPNASLNKAGSKQEELPQKTVLPVIAEGIAENTPAEGAQSVKGKEETTETDTKSEMKVQEEQNKEIKTIEKKDVSTKSNDSMQDATVTPEIEEDEDSFWDLTPEPSPEREIVPNHIDTTKENTVVDTNVPTAKTESITEKVKQQTESQKQSTNEKKEKEEVTIAEKVSEKKSDTSDVKQEEPSSVNKVAETVPVAIAEKEAEKVEVKSASSAKSEETSNKSTDIECLQKGTSDVEATKSEAKADTEGESKVEKSTKEDLSQSTNTKPTEESVSFDSDSSKQSEINAICEENMIQEAQTSDISNEKDNAHEITEEELIPNKVEKVECQKQSEESPKGINEETLKGISEILTKTDNQNDLKAGEVKEKSPSPVSEELISPTSKGSVQSEPSNTTEIKEIDDNKTVEENIPEASEPAAVIEIEQNVQDASQKNIEKISEPTEDKEGQLDTKVTAVETDMELPESKEPEKPSTVAETETESKCEPTEEKVVGVDTKVAAAETDTEVPESKEPEKPSLVADDETESKFKPTEEKVEGVDTKVAVVETDTEVPESKDHEKPSAIAETAAESKCDEVTSDEKSSVGSPPEPTVEEKSVAEKPPMDSALTDKTDYAKTSKAVPEPEPNEEQIDDMTYDRGIDDALFFC